MLLYPPRLKIIIVLAISGTDDLNIFRGKLLKVDFYWPLNSCVENVQTNCCCEVSDDYLEKQAAKRCFVKSSLYKSSLNFENFLSTASSCVLKIFNSVTLAGNANLRRPFWFCLDHALFTRKGVNNVKIARDSEPIRLLESPRSLSTFVFTKGVCL